jgi:hypothetical protein
MEARVELSGISTARSDLHRVLGPCKAPGWGVNTQALLA